MQKRFRTLANNGSLPIDISVSEGSGGPRVDMTLGASLTISLTPDEAMGLAERLIDGRLVLLGVVDERDNDDGPS